MCIYIYITRAMHVLFEKYFLREFFDFVGTNNFDLGGRKMSKNIFKVCSNIQNNTQNPNTIFKITICFTKYTQTNPNTFDILETFGNNLKIPTNQHVVLLFEYIP